MSSRTATPMIVLMMSVVLLGCPSDGGGGDGGRGGEDAAEAKAVSEGVREGGAEAKAALEGASEGAVEGEGVCEDCALGVMRTISTAEASFQAAAQITDASGMGQFGTLAQLLEAKLISNIQELGQKWGYTFTAIPVVGNPPTYTATATSTSPMPKKNYFVDQSGVIRFVVSAGVDATVNDPPV